MTTRSIVRPSVDVECIHTKGLAHPIRKMRASFSITNKPFTFVMLFRFSFVLAVWCFSASFAIHSHSQNIWINVLKTSNNKTTQHTIRSFRTWTNVGSCGCNIFDSLVYWSCRHAIVRIARFYRVDLLTSMENTTNTYQRSYRESHFFFFFSLSTFPHSVCSRLLFPFSVLCILYMTHFAILFKKKHSFFYLICDSRLSDS